MPVITQRDEAEFIISDAASKGVSLAIFCTASHWNTEAILLAASNFAKKNNIKKIPVVAAVTFNYKYMSQARRVTRSGSPEAGFIAIMEYIRLLCEGEYAPYPDVAVLPHLDHGDPVKDRWALTEGLPYLASVMFDAQKYPFDENLSLTRSYVERYGGRIMVEGAMEELSVSGNAQGKGDGRLIEKAMEYVDAAKVDFLVADLGTEQQSTSVGKSVYLKERARSLTKSLGKPMLVLHGTSCLSADQMMGLADDGVIRVNMWTRIARDAGQYAADRLFARARGIYTGDFEAAESKQYLYDSIDEADRIMEETLGLLGYKNLGI